MEEELIEILEGTFKRTIYKSSSYMVSIFDTHDGQITVTGPSFETEKDTKYTVVGKYVDHPKYGFQFEMISISKYLPSAKEEIIKYLSSPLFKGVGKKAAEKIYDIYGDESLRVIKNDLSALDKVNISDSQRKSIIDAMSKIDDNNSDVIFNLINCGYTSKEANLIYTHFKDNLNDVLYSNPFKFYLDVYGISLQKVAKCSRNLSFDNGDSKYREAYLIYIFKEISFRAGDIYLYEDDFKYEYLKSFDDFDITLNICINDGYLVEDSKRYYLKKDYEDEYYIANFLNRSLNGELMIDDINLSSSIETNSAFNNIEYDEKQIHAIENFFNFETSLIIGGPGTGKTTVIKALVEIFTDYFPYNNIIVIAPTGRAAKRINEICEVQSKTIHSLLRWDKETNTFIHNESNPILYDAIIIDEFSMVDNSLFAALLKASVNVKKICIIGDDNQLPSIRQGNVLKDLITSNIFPLTRLDIIHRQKQGNEIIDLAYSIVNDRVDFDMYTNDVRFIDIKTFSKEQLVDLINEDLNNGNDIDSIQVLSPMYRGEYGIDALNLSLQDSFNKKSNDKIERRIANCLYREHDKILQLKNRPDDDVYNGDIGELEEININERTFLINYKGIYIYYSFDDLIDISLAYAMSVHKSQGSEYNVVYFICNKEHYHMLYRKLIYTAISRAKNKLVIIGDKDVFISAIQKDIKDRKTTLKDRIINYK